ncbi:MAG: hypothetical protein IPK26_25790 [Planctomycetes bacterium]|nr:hypothetical protein [Planctomycetota bacterium]
MDRNVRCCLDESWGLRAADGSLRRWTAPSRSSWSCSLICWRCCGSAGGPAGTPTAPAASTGGRTLGPWVAALAANASSSSAWSLVGTSGFAFQHGLAALWLIPGCVGGFLLNWLCIAPRVRDRTGGAVTMNELPASRASRAGRRCWCWRRC